MSDRDQTLLFFGICILAVLIFFARHRMGGVVFWIWELLFPSPAPPEPGPSSQPSDDIGAALDSFRAEPSAFIQEIVGESHYQNALSRLAGGKTTEGHELELPAELVPDAANPFDKHAVSVRVNGVMIGYLNRKDAARYRERFKAQRVECRALIVGGWYRGGGDEGKFGVKLDFEV